MRPRGGAPVRSGSGTDLSRPDRLGRPGQSTVACLGMGRACHPEQCSDETDYSDAEQTHDLALELRRPRRQFAAVRRVTAPPIGLPSCRRRRTKAEHYSGEEARLYVRR